MQNIKKSYNILDKYRIYKKNEYGEPNNFNFRIESIGFLNSNQLMYDSIFTLNLMLCDILNSINFEDNKFSSNDKINFLYKNDELIITINNENHTIGNLISEYSKLLFLLDSNGNNLLKFSSYNMPHPLKESIEIKYILNQDSSTYKKNRAIEILLNEIMPNYQIPVSFIHNDKDLLILIFIRTIINIKLNLKELLQEWTDLTSLNKASYDIHENEEYLNKYDISVFKLDEINHL